MKRSFIFPLAFIAMLMPQSQADNVLRDGDVFEMRLSGPPEEFTWEFTLTLTVDEGSVNLPMAGRLRTAGFSNAGLAAIVEKRLKDEKIFTVANVNITLNPNTPARQQMVIVGGAVRNPGRQLWMANLSLKGAISSAGGPADFVKDTVRLIRAGKSNTFSLRAMKKDPSQDPTVLPGDFIEVDGE